MTDDRHEIEVTNAHPLRLVPTDGLAALVARVLTGEGETGATVGLILTDGPTIHRLNREFLAHDCVTDVISFRLDDGDEIEGEIYVCLDQAERQAPDFGATYPEEVLRLAIHGALHLCGWDDATDGERAAMHERENVYLRTTDAQPDDGGGWGTAPL